MVRLRTDSDIILPHEWRADPLQILYSMPISATRLEDLNDAQEKCAGKAVIRLMVDHPAQITALDAYSKRTGKSGPWSVFMKVDGGGQ
jgi:D-serine deaminase-like pyridoxal phosphate-dependent protein